MKSKYIIIEMDGMEVPFVFSRFLSHEDVALCVKNSIRSAGFCELNAAGKWVASGQSVTLKLDATAGLGNHEQCSWEQIISSAAPCCKTTPSDKLNHVKKSRPSCEVFQVNLEVSA